MQPNPARSEVRLPRAVVQRTERINARIAARHAAAEEPNPADPTDPATPPADPADPGTLPVDPPADPRHADPAYWKSRFDNTAGVLAAVRREHTATVADLKGQIVELEAKASNLETALAAAPPAAAPALDLKEFFTPEQIEQYGEEQCAVMVNAAAKAALKVQKAVPAAQPAPPAPTPAAPAAPQKTAKDTLMEKLDELLPEWRVWDQDPRLHVWLAEEENKVPRQAILNVHIGNGDAAKIVSLYERWDREMQTPAKPARTPPVSPSGSGAGPSDEPPAPAANMRPPTPTEVRDFYKRAALNKVSDKERTNFEARLALRNPGR